MLLAKDATLTCCKLETSTMGVVRCSLDVDQAAMMSDAMALRDGLVRATVREAQPCRPATHKPCRQQHLHQRGDRHPGDAQASKTHAARLRLTGIHAAAGRVQGDVVLAEQVVALGRGLGAEFCHRRYSTLAGQLFEAGFGDDLLVESPS